MRLIRAATAFAFGFVAFYFIWVWLGGFMAARALPAHFFAFFASFGQVGKELGLAVINVLLHLVPTVCLIVAITLVPASLAAADRKAIGLAVLAGAAVGYVSFLALFSAPAESAVQSLALALKQVTTAPWWALPSSVAPVLGIAIAYGLLAMHSRRRAEA